METADTFSTAHSLMWNLYILPELFVSVTCSFVVLWCHLTNVIILFETSVKCHNINKTIVFIAALWH